MQFTIYTSEHQGAPTRMDYPHTAIIDTEDPNALQVIIAATRMDHTAIDFGGNGRGKKNFSGSDCIMGDIDNADVMEDFWTTLDVLKKELAGYAFAVTPSRNHMKAKGKETARPKWHLYFPIPHTDDFEKFERLTAMLHERFPELGFDANVKDAARFFFGHGGNCKEAWIQDGKPISKAFAGRPKGTGKPKVIPWRDLTLEELSENPEVVPSGERYEIHKALAMFWANKGINAEGIEERLIDFNSRMTEPRPMYQEKIRRETAKLAASAAAKVEAEGGASPDAVFNRIRNYRIQRSQGGQASKVAVRSTTESMRAAMKHFVSLVSRNGARTLTLRENPSIVISKPAQLSGALEKIGFIWDVRNVPGALTKEDILARFITDSEEIIRMTCVPEHPLEPGTLFVPQISFPEARSTGALRKFLETFSFKTDADRYRFAAGVLSLYLPSSFDGKIPMFALLAEAQNAGKTTVVRSTVDIVTGMKALEQKGGRFNQSDDHAQFGGVLGLAARGVLYDNLTNLDQEAETEIARAITDENRSAWTMHVSRGHIRNSYVYFATFNDSEGFGRDLQERIVAIRMMDPAKVDRDKREGIMDRLAVWREKREEIIADIRHLIGIQTPLERDETIPMEKYVEWTRRIAPGLRLMFPEISCFDFSSQREDHRIDPSLVVLTEFSIKLFETQKDRAVKDIAGGWKLAFGAVELFEQFSGFSPDAARGYTLQQFTRMVGQAGRDLGDIRLVKRKARGLIVYEFIMDDAAFEEISAKGSGSRAVGADPTALY